MNSPESSVRPRSGLARGLRQERSWRAEFTLACQTLVVTGFSEDEVREAETATRMQLAFYASTPQYRCVLDVHGWGALQDELNRLSKAGRWLEMGALIDDRMLDTLAVRCAPADLPARLATRWRGMADRVSILCHANPQQKHPTEWREILAACRRACP
jgi:hypothetical protein